MQIITASTENELFESASSWIVEAIVRHMEKKGICVIGTVGGRSLPGLLEQLLLHANELKHGNIELFWLDERVGKEKNYDGAISYLEKLHKAGVPIIWHPFIGLTREEISLEIVSHEQTIIALQESLRFDIIITSSGEDGHVASLFPHSIALQEKEPKYLFVENVPKPPPLRISASPGLLLTADDAFLFIVGDKKPAYNAFVNPAVPVTQCPAKLLQDLPQLIVFVCVK